MPAPEGTRRVADCVWELPPTLRAGMRVPVRICATETLLHAMDDQVFHQAANVATLPGIVGYSFVMPDAHWGYGFPIGGVAAMDPRTGVISPGGIGFDINCGMRLVLTDLTLEEVQPKLRDLVDVLYQRVPAGVGSRGFLKVSQAEFAEVIEEGTRWCVRKGYGTKEDLERTEEHGCLTGADASAVSPRAIERGYRQIGTLGSGNHYLEIQVARPEHVVDATLAAALASESHHAFQVGSIDITMWACIAPAQACTAWLGARVAPLVSAEHLSRVFAIALTVTGITMLHSSLA